MLDRSNSVTRYTRDTSYRSNLTYCRAITGNRIDSDSIFPARVRLWSFPDGGFSIDGTMKNIDVTDTSRVALLN